MPKRIAFIYIFLYNVTYHCINKLKGKRSREMKKFWEKWTGIALVKRILVGLILGAILGVAVPQATGISILGDVFVSALKAIRYWYSFWL